MLTAAIALVDSGGVTSLSMRKLGQALGVEAMSLYNHVANKDALLDGLLDSIVQQFGLPSVDADWKIALQQSMISAHGVLMSHPWACTLSMTRPSIGPAKLRFAEAMTGCLRRAGFSVQLTHDAMHALDNHLYGFTAQELALGGGFEPMGGEVAAILAGHRTEKYPYLSEVVPRAVHDQVAEFALVLELILDGFERLRG